jgi:hypothetical protein
MLVGVWVSVQAQEVDRDVTVARGSCLRVRQGESWTICIFIGIKQDICSIVFVVAGSRCKSGFWSWNGSRKAYSRAHLYGSKTSILGRAHVCKLKGDVFAAIFAGYGCSMDVDESSSIFGGKKSKSEPCRRGVESARLAVGLVYASLAARLKNILFQSLRRG